MDRVRQLAGYRKLVTRISEKMIHKIIEECRFGIHDISRTELDGNSNLPRLMIKLQLHTSDLTYADKIQLIEESLPLLISSDLPYDR